MDELYDTQVGTELLEYDNFEPFPSIDLPQKGICTVASGVITWVSGGAIGGTATGFNTRWLAGTTILIGSPSSLAYTLTSRPTSNASITIANVPDGANLAYEIPEPVLAAQPLAYVFGPTDNINFAYATGDPLRPGTFYWCKGSNMDSAPDTNQQDITDPSEPMVNGAMSGGLGVIASIKRAWIIIPNFFNAQATVTGTQGSTWTLQATSISRGLYMPRCIAVQGGGRIYFRVEDGIHVSQGGGGSQSITDEDLYPLFPHEGSTPQSVTRSGVTVVPPDDTQPQKQQFAVVAQHLYWDYLGTDGVQHTLVYDTEAQGWIWDASVPRTTCHATSDGQSQQGVLAGCVDATVRNMLAAGSEAPAAIVQSGAIGGIGYQHCSGFTIEYASAQPITLTSAVADSGNGSYAPAVVTLPATGGVLTKYRGWFSPNKWKLLQLTLTFTDPTALVHMQGFEIDTRSWGENTPYRQVAPFGDEGGYGSQS